MSFVEREKSILCTQPSIFPCITLRSLNAAFNVSSGYPGLCLLFLRASALGAERVNGLWLSNAGGGAVNLLSRTFVNIAHRGYQDDGT